jgi:hypothetical protein
MFCILLILLWLLYILKNNKSTIIEDESDSTNTIKKPIPEPSNSKILTHSPDVSIKLKEESIALEKFFKENNKSGIIAGYMICIGLSSKAFWMYHTQKYDDSVKFYTDQYDLWFNNQNNDNILKECYDNLKSWNIKL